MNRLVALGLLAAGLALAAMLVPGLVAVPLDRTLVRLAGVGVLLLAYRAVTARRRAGFRRTMTGDPEVPTPSAVPGTDLYAAIRTFSGEEGSFTRERLREAAVAVLTRYDGLSEASARDSVADGSWTDDETAAAHLREDRHTPPLRRRLGRRFRRESAYRTEQRRAIEAIAGVAGFELEPPERRFWLPNGRFPADRVTEIAVDEEEARLDTGAWRGVSAVALSAVGVGALAELAPVMLSGVVGVGVATYARAATPPSVDLDVSRAVDPPRPEPGEAVSVTLTVRNLGDRLLPDLRVVDGVPPALDVAEGSPRTGTALRPGEEAAVTYAVPARRGVHEFEPVTVIVRDLAGVSEVRRTVAVPTTVTCVPDPRPTAVPVPIRPAATRFAGSNPTASGGEGVEFFGSRAYQPGDPTHRIDWNRRARTGELVTIDYREEREATVVVVVDARRACFLAPSPRAPHAVDRAADGAIRSVETLLAAGDRVGVAAFGSDCWLPPGAGMDQRGLARELLATHAAFSPAGPPVEPLRGWRRRLERRLPTDAQLLVFSPLCDAESTRLARRFDAVGHPTTVVSPDPTTATAPGPLLARTARRVRITDLRRAGVPVLDWPPGVPIEIPFARHDGGSSR